MIPSPLIEIALAYCWHRETSPPSVGQFNHVAQLSPTALKKRPSWFLQEVTAHVTQMLWQTDLCLQRMWCSCEPRWPYPESCGRQAECCGAAASTFRTRLQSPARPAKEYFSRISVHSVSPEWKQGWVLWRKWISSDAYCDTRVTSGCACVSSR